MKRYPYDERLNEGVQDYELDMPSDDTHTDAFAEKIPYDMIELAHDRYADDGGDDDIIARDEYD